MLVCQVQDFQAKFLSWIEGLAEKAQSNPNTIAQHLAALVSTSGCGKSSLLSTIAGLQAADRGQIYLQGDRTDTVAAGFLPVG